MNINLGGAGGFYLFFGLVGGLLGYAASTDGLMADISPLAPVTMVFFFFALIGLAMGATLDGYREREEDPVWWARSPVAAAGIGAWAYLGISFTMFLGLPGYPTAAILAIGILATVGGVELLSAFGAEPATRKTRGLFGTAVSVLCLGSLAVNSHFGPGPLPDRPVIHFLASILTCVGLSVAVKFTRKKLDRTAVQR